MTLRVAQITNEQVSENVKLFLQPPPHHTWEANVVALESKLTQRQDVQHSLAVQIKAVFAVHLSAKQTCNPSQCESINSAVYEATISEQS